MPSEREVSVRCHNCRPDPGYVMATIIVSGESTSASHGTRRQRLTCQWCKGTGAYLATLADPEAETLMADGEKWRQYWRHGEPTSGSYSTPSAEVRDG